jgi:predicted ATPase/signal transduction histidine kinase
MGPVVRLSDLVAERAPGLTQALELIVRVCGLLEPLHAAGTVHGAIRPETIGIDETLDRVRLIDGGPDPRKAYVAPEQTGRTSRSMDSRTDMYLIGLTLYELLTGARAFEAGDAIGMIHAHIARAPTPPHERNAAIPAVISRIAMRLLAKNAEDRYQTVASLIADLQRCLSHLAAGEALPEFETADTHAKLEVPTRLYGRERERRLLHDAFDRASTMRSEILTLCGSSGVGKSALVHELRHVVAERGGFLAEGKFDQLRRDVPYSALRQALRSLCRHLLTRSDTELAEWRERILAAVGVNGQLMVDLVPDLAAVIGPQPSVEQLAPGDAQVRFRQVLEALVRVLATRGHPLVLFLDDLQWIDGSTLGVIEILFSAPGAGLLVIGAYREREIEGSHPLAGVLEDLARADRVQSLRLEPLARDSVAELLRDTLHASADELAGLTALVFERTGGNPFFTAQFLAMLHEDGLLTRRGSRWRWDLDAIGSAGISENVLELMIHKLSRLDASTRTAICRAACIGSAFEVARLAAISGVDTARALAELRPAIHAGFVLVSDGEVRFLHDRVQQAAYALIPAAEREAMHLEIGRTLLAHADPDALDDGVFDVVAHLNVARRLIVSERERDELRALNLRAAERARASVAFSALLELLQVAVELLPEDAWQRMPAIADDVHLRLAEASYLDGRFDTADELVAKVLEQTRSTISTIRAHEIMVMRAMAAGEPVAAARISLRLLAQLGITIPEHARERDVAFEFIKCRLRLALHSTERLRRLPEMSDAEVLATMEFCMLSLPPVSYGAPAAFPLVLMTMLKLTLKHGHSPLSPVPFLGFGIILARLGDYARAKKYTELAWELQNRFGSKKVKVYMTSGWLLFLRWYWEPFGDVARRTGHENYKEAADVGNLEFMAHELMNGLSLRFLAGEGLDALQDQGVKALATIHQLRQWTTLDATRPAVLTVQSLLDGDRSWTEQAPTGSETDRNPMAVFMWAAYAAYLDVVCGDGELAVAITAAGERSLATIPITYHHVLYRFAESLALLRVHGRKRDREVEHRLARNHKALRAWARVSPFNVRHKLLLVEAERASVDGRRAAAEAGYAEAAEAAIATGAIHDAALARERFAYHLLREGRREAAAEQLWLALRHYRRWGAHAKVEQLQQAHPDLSEREAGEADGGALDLDSVRKAARALSGEIVLKTLLRQLMAVMLENAGALAGRLILNREGDGWRVDVDLEIGTEAQFRATPLDDADDVPRSLVNYVIRTKDTVVLEDAATEHAFADDRYFRTHDATSVLALPILKQNTVIGVLYLENTLTRGAFTADRLEVLTILAGQAATSIENALLYESLERKVAERTAELERLQSIALANAHHAGMAEIATGVLHNVGNVLNSVNVSVETLSGHLALARVSGVRKAAELLQANTASLGSFFADDPRGKALPLYLEKLGTSLEAQGTAAADEIERLRSKVRLIADVVSGQQSYAKGAALTEESDLARIVDEVLGIQASALTRKHIRVLKRYQAVAPVAVQRTKLAHVLVNLIKNAEDAMESTPEEDREITIDIDEHDGETHVRITDRGQGIEPSNLDRIFTHGFTTKVSGHGFGLHFCANSMTEMDGKLVAWSEGQGRGAAFTLVFRRAALARAS